MDRRWLLIILILIVGLGCLYFIVDNSTSVGTAIASVDQVIVTLPPGFTNFQTHDNSVGIENKYTKEKLYLESIEHKDTASSRFNKTVSNLQEKEDVKVINYTTINVKNVTAYIVYYQNISSGTPENHMTGYFYDFNSTFVVSMEKFSDYNKGESNIRYIIDTLYTDYKKPKN